jgi:hypothetical protein
MKVVKLNDYRPKNLATVKAEHCMKEANDYANRLRQQGFPEIKISLMVNDFLWRLAESIK